MAINKNILQAKELSFSYGENTIFSDLSFTLRRGETLCLLGPNGSGKTTLLDCILGSHKPSQGKIFLEEEDLHTISAKQRARYIAYVPQQHSRSFSFSVEEVLLTGRAPYIPFHSRPQAPDREAVRHLLASLDMLSFAERDYTSLSGGEMQLVMILRALVQDTPCIVMDEPTAHLDYYNELWVLETIVNLIKEKQISLIMATHFPNHAFYLEHAAIPVKVLFMSRGKPWISGIPAEVLSSHTMEYYYGVSALIQDLPLSPKENLRYVIPLTTTKQL